MARGNWGDIEIRFGTRLCEVEGQLGYFHCWEYYSTVVDASQLMGGAPAGVFSKVFGIVEFADRVARVDPTDIKFCDDENALLNAMVKHMKGE